MARKHQQHGYSIVEMGIVLVVIGLLLGAVLLPLGAHLRNKQAREARELLARVETSLIGYAANSSTTPSVVRTFGSGTPPQAVSETIIPAGRRFLPCPDVTGDGLEDRSYGDVAGSSTTFTAVRGAQLAPADVRIVVDDAHGVATTLALAHQAYEPHVDRVLTIASDRDVNQLVGTSTGSSPFGACASDKGSVPWATLGVPAADPWGNLITYRVDPMFSHGAIGFGIETRSDAIDPRFPLLLTVSNAQTLTTYSRRNASFQAAAFIFDSKSLQYTNDDLPGIVCDGIDNLGTTHGCSSDNPDIQDARLLNPLVTVTTGLTLFDVYPHITIARIYQQNDILNGMAFVLVSHGPNGNGALRLPITGEQGNATTRVLPCREFVGRGYPGDYSESLAEVVNASWKGQCNSSTFSLPTRSNPRFHGFVDQPGGASFDDELRHLSGEQLIGRLLEQDIRLGAPWIPPAGPGVI